MAIRFSNSLMEDLAGCIACEANGIANYPSGETPPAVIPGRVFFDAAPDGLIALHSKIIQGDELNVGGTRAEISLPDDPFDTPIWYTWDMYVPSNWPQTGKPYTVMQIHDSPDGAETPVNWPNLEMVIADTRMYAKIGEDFANESTTGARVLGDINWPVIFDEFVHCALYATWKKSVGGHMAFYYGGKLVAQQHHFRTAYDDVVGPYLRLGVYDVHHYLDFGMLEAWYRNIVLYDGADGPMAALGTTPITGVNRGKCLVGCVPR